MVTEIIDELKVLEKNVDAQMSFGGNGGKLQGLYAYHGWRFNANITGKTEFKSAADQNKKRKTISQAWRPVCTHACSSEGKGTARGRSTRGKKDA
ncbi:hypothetical protein IC582_010251 [Cucumis melo]